MPSEHMPAQTSDRERFPSLKEDIGEDPARWLDRPLFGGGGDTSSPGLMIQARVRGIDEIAECRAWKAVERALDRGPRQRVLEMLDERESELAEIGERPERLEHGPRRPPEMQADSQTDWYLVRDGERIAWEEVDRSVGLGGRRDLGGPVEAQVATDGGEST